jgi:uncharacterized protein YgbK (DUF1537 family)
VISKNESIADNNISVGEAESNEDVASWANKAGTEMLLAGGASFFEALLAKDYQFKTENKEPIELSSPMLLISGTTFQKNVQLIKEHSHLVSYLPAKVFADDNPGEAAFYQWRDDILNKISKHNKAIIAINNSSSQKADPNLLREKMATIAALILSKTKIQELLIEGGSTAYSIISKIGWTSFQPTEELKQGIVRMTVQDTNDLHLTIKPGSYDWPAEWNFK